jgi:MYXO-CTERM domain-containing protein
LSQLGAAVTWTLDGKTAAAHDNINFQSDSVGVTEPGTLLLSFLGLGGLALLRPLRRKA